MRVKWTRKALDNLDSAVEFIAADKPRAAAGVTKKIWEAAQRLATQPGIERPGQGSGDTGAGCPRAPFIFPYIEKDGAIFILRVIHSAMKWPQGF